MSAMTDHDKTKDQLIAENEELRQRVATLEAAERRYRTIIDTVPLAIGEINRDGIIVFANAATEELFGYKPEELVGKRAGDGIEPASAREAFRAWFRHTMLEQPTPSPVFAHQVNKNGEQIDVRGDWNYLRNAKGEVTGQVTIVADITELKRAEEELAKSKAILSAAVECLPFDFFAVDSEGRCILQNAVSRQLYGDALGRTAEQVCPDERVLPRWVEGSRRALAGEKVERETAWWVRGEERCFCSFLSPIQDGGKVYGVLGVNVDITARKRAEEALRQNESRYRALAESTSDIIYILDRQGTLLYANQAASQCIGIRSDEIPGKRQAALFPPEMAQAHIEKIGRVFATGEVLKYDELFHFGPQEVWLHIHLVPLWDEAGQISSVMGVCHNITDRKRAEEALQKAHDELEQRVRDRTAELAKANQELAIFRKFAEASGQGFSMADLDGRLTYLNPTLCRMLGDKGPEDRIGQHLSICYSEESNRRGKQEIEPVLKREGYWQGELPMRSRQGKSIPTWHNSFLIRDDSGNPLRLAVVITDITERKAAEEALRISEEKYRGVAEACPDAIVMSDLNGRVLFASRQTWGLLGLADSDELVGQSVFDYVIEGDRKRLAENMSQLVGAGVRRNTEYTALRKDGTTIPAEVSSSVIRNAEGQPKAVMAVLRDITERKQNQEALRQSEERYELAVRGAGVGIWDWDIRTGKLYFSPRWKMIFGYDENDIGDSLDDWARLLHPDERPWILKFQEDFLAGTSPTVTAEYRLRHKDGSYRWIVAHGLVVRDEAGKAIRLVGSHGDITDRKQAEEALARERQTLWHMLQASDYERQTISYDIHDGLAQYLAAAGMQFEVFDGLRESNPEAANKAYDAATQLVSQSHAEARRLVSEVRPPIIDEIGLETAISHLVHEQRRHGGPNIEFDSDVQFDRLTSILENALYRIVQEALTNACTHSKSKKVTVTMTQEGQDVRLEVRDWGIGFDPGLVAKGHFGLEGIRQRVRLLGGRLKIESTPGSGTLVQVVVPIVGRQSEE
jgi:PAS domain S-box-containing protein